METRPGERSGLPPRSADPKVARQQPDHSPGPRAGLDDGGERSLKEAPVLGAGSARIVAAIAFVLVGCSEQTIPVRTFRGKRPPGSTQLDHGDSYARRRAVAALSGAGPEVVPALREAPRLSRSGGARTGGRGARGDRRCRASVARRRVEETGRRWCASTQARRSSPSVRAQPPTSRRRSPIPTTTCGRMRWRRSWASGRRRPVARAGLRGHRRARSARCRRGSRSDPESLRARP